MTGREFTIKTWGPEYWENPGTWSQELKQDLAEYHFSVPDGYWVAEAVQSACLAHRVIGRPGQIHAITVNDQWHHCTSKLYVATKPFGVVTYFADSAGEGGTVLRCAQQIHKGELGRTGPPVPKLPQVREPKLWGKKTKSRRKNFSAWTNLADLLRASGLSAVEILHGYALYLDHKYDPRYQHTVPRIPVVQCQDLPAAFREGSLSHNALYGMPLNKLMELVWNDAFQPDDWWIRHGAAKTVLRLQAFGVKPHESIRNASLLPSGITTVMPG